MILDTLFLRKSGRVICNFNMPVSLFLVILPVQKTGRYAFFILRTDICYLLYHLNVGPIIIIINTMVWFVAQIALPFTNSLLSYRRLFSPKKRFANF